MLVASDGRRRHLGTEGRCLCARGRAGLGALAAGQDSSRSRGALWLVGIRAVELELDFYSGINSFIFND